MVKLVNLLVRAEDFSHAEFVEYLKQTHAPIARELPGLRRYVTSVPRDPTVADYDAIAELYFEDGDDLEQAFESDVGQRVQADAEAFLDLDAGTTLVVDETVHLDR